MVQHEPDRKSLRSGLRLLQLRLLLERLLVGTARGFCFGLAVAFGGAFALVAQSGLVDRSVLAIIALAALVGGGLLVLLRPPSLQGTARMADSRYGLDARLGTAVELVRRRDSGRLVIAQVADASAALKGASRGWPMPWVVAWRECLVASIMLVLLLVTLTFEGQGASLLVGAPGFGNTAEGAGERQVLAQPTAVARAATQASGQPGKAAGAMRTLDELRRARESGALPTDKAQSTLDRLESELNEGSAEARSQRETLDRLARALSQVSAAEAAAESIQRGDYAQAAEDLAQLGRESDQLSPEAKNQLAQALRRAAAETPDQRALAERERRAADALAGRDYQAAQGALGALGNEVARTASQSETQAELAEAMERLQRERDQSGASASAGVASGTGDRASDANSPRSALGQPGGSQAGDGEGTGLGSGSSPAESGVPGQNAGAQANAAGGEKTSPTDFGAAAPRLDVAGQQVEVPARPGLGAERGGPSDRAEDGEVLDQAQTTYDSDRLASQVQAGGQAERVVVPGTQRQVVRDYFGKRNERATP